jgi:SAM-dependent methyltransferase
MGIKDLFNMAREQNLLDLARFMRDWRSFIRFHFLFAAVESGLLNALGEPRSREDLIRYLEVTRPELLDALLDVGLALGEVAYQKGLYRVKGKYARAMMGGQADVLSALVQANVTYYSAAYREYGDRLRGAALGNYLEDIGSVVARFSRIVEPGIRRFARNTVEGKGPLRLLEVGCGSGVYLRIVAQTNPHATGIGMDLDRAVVDQAQQNLRQWGISDRFQVVAGDIRHPPAEVKGSFALITLYNLLYYFPEDERVNLFRTLRSKLSPNGSLVIVSSFRGQGRDLFVANLNLATSSIAGCTPLPNLDETKAQLRAGGFSTIEKSKLMPQSSLYGIVAQ